LGFLFFSVIQNFLLCLQNYKKRLHKIFSKNLFVGKKVVYLPKCHSTNTVASELVASQPANEGTIVITDHQLAGRGQRGNSWESESGKNLTFSVILCPSFLHPSQQFELTVITSLAVAVTLEKFVLEQVCIKWPNDIYVGSKKIAGILIENTIKAHVIESAVVGVGVNVNQQHFAIDSATSIMLLKGEKIEKDLLLVELSAHLEAYYLQLRAGRIDELRSLYLSKMLGVGKQRSFSDTGGIFLGSVVGVDSAGRLEILRDNYIYQYSMKEIQFVL